MPLSLARGEVTAIVERTAGLVRLEVDGEPCIAFPRLTGPVGLGDDVVVNEQARELGLGSGAHAVLYANLSRGLGLERDAEAHVMKLPYTPLQFAVRHAEENHALASTLAGTPVVCCSLHSQLAPVRAGLGEGIRVDYVQLPGGALPVSLSDTVRFLRTAGLIENAVAAESCFDGDVQCATTASALAWAAADGADAVICAIGPGIVGTASSLGHGGVAAASAANAASALAGSPVLAARVSSHETRARHRGVSHHTRAALALCLGEVVIGWPAGFAAPGWLEPRVEVDASAWREACSGLPLSHMGRGPGEDSAFFAAAYAAGLVARGLLASDRFAVRARK